MVMAIRPAGPPDIPDLSRLRWQLYDEIAPVLGETYASYEARFTQFADAALRSGAWHALVATEDARVVAAMWVYRVPRIPQPGRGPAAPLAYLTNVYVEPVHRDGGLGSLMLADVEDRCRREGFSLIMAWPSDRSYPFYERAGFSRPPDPVVRGLRAP